MRWKPCKMWVYGFKFFWNGLLWKSINKQCTVNNNVNPKTCVKSITKYGQWLNEWHNLYAWFLGVGMLWTNLICKVVQLDILYYKKFKCDANCGCVCDISWFAFPQYMSGVWLWTTL